MNDLSLELPASPDLLHVVRAVVSGVAAIKGMTYDAIDMLCLSASEAAAALISLPGHPERLSLRMRVDDDVEITLVTHRQPNGAEPIPLMEWEPLAWKILSSLADDLALVNEDDRQGVRITMKGR